MDPPSQPFPDNCIASDLVLIREERPDVTEATRRASGEGAAPPSKRQKVIYSCEPCGKPYTEKRALARHKHTDLHRKNTGLPPLEKYACTFQPCSKSFTRDHDRRRHEDEAHRGRKRTNMSRTSPSSASSAPDLECIQERSFIIDDDVTSPPNRWDQLASDMEVLPRPAKWADSRRHDRQYRLVRRKQNSAWKHSDPADEVTPTSSGSNEQAKRKHSQSWFNENSEDDEGRMQDNSTPERRMIERSKSSAADSAVDMSEDLNAPHEPKRPSITTYDYRNEQADEKVSASNPNDEFEARPITPSKAGLPSRLKASIIQKSGKAVPQVQNIQDTPAKRPLFCAFCDQAFADNEHDLWPHLRQHLDTFSGNKSIWCNTCKIPFKLKADLDKHRMSADLMNHCGFNFKHSLNCTGHHPPNKAALFPGLTDRDRFTLCTELDGWELKQLQLYMSQIDEVVATVKPSRPNTIYSVEALYGHKQSGDSYSSFAISVNTHTSAPCDRGVNDGAVDVKGLGTRLKMMSMKSPTMNLRHTAKKLPSMLRSGISIKPDPAHCSDF